MIPQIEKRFYDEMAERGVTKTVYGLVYPEVEQVYLDVYTNRKRIGALFDEPYTRRQNNMHEALIGGYVDWAKEIAPIDRKVFSHVAPTSGSSEAIRETIAYHGNWGETYVYDENWGTNRVHQEGPTIHVFDGEYEGYQAYAAAHNVGLIFHDRNDYEHSIGVWANRGDRFYLSQPSGIDGNIWKGYDDFMKFLAKEQPDLKVMLDLAYVGTFANPDVVIDTTHKNIEAIFFSLSKTFGTYYQRIGGMFSKTDFPGLTGNSWFKNLPSIEVGAELMRNFGVQDLPKKYKSVQQAIVTDLGREFGPGVEASDVILLATQPTSPAEPNEFKRLLTRVDKVRYCLTPRLDKMIKAKV